MLLRTKTWNRIQLLDHREVLSFLKAEGCIQAAEVEEEMVKGKGKGKARVASPDRRKRQVQTTLKKVHQGSGE